MDAQKDDLSKIGAENGESTNEATNDANLPNNDSKDHWDFKVEEDLQGKYDKISYLDAKSLNIQNDDKNDHIQVLESYNNGKITNDDLLYDTFIS